PVPALPCLALSVRRRCPLPPPSTPFPYTTLFRSGVPGALDAVGRGVGLGSRDLVGRGGVARALVGERDLQALVEERVLLEPGAEDRKSTRLNSSHVKNSYAVFCLKKKRAPRERHA